MKVTIMRGLPGSGKSTLAHKLVFDQKGSGQFSVGSIYSADQFFMNHKGVYVFDKSQIGKAHEACLKGFVTGLLWVESRQNPDDILVVDNTNTTFIEILPYAKLALAFGAELEVVTIECDVDTAVKRNTHNVPRKTIEAMSERIKQFNPQISKEWNHRFVGAQNEEASAGGTLP